MDIIQAVLMGIVQGLSEFLPISSSAHLVFTSNFYKVFRGIEIIQNTNQEVFLDIMLHLGTLIAVLVYFRREITEILKALYTGLKTKNYVSENFKTGVYIILGTFLTVVIAIPLCEISKKLVFRPDIVGCFLILTGIVLLLSEHLAKKTNHKNKISLSNAVWIGLSQGLASLPGFSRSGWTIAAGLLGQVERISAARYSFLLSIPIILGASMVYPLFEIDFNEAMKYNWIAIIVGTIVSGIVGYACIKYFLKFVSKFSLAFFGYYCLAVGIFTAIFFTVVSWE